MRSTPPRRPSQPDSLTRTSYQVGSPWMFEGKMLRGLMGTPMRRIAFANRVLAEAEPDPFTLANLTTKSLTASRRFMWEFKVSTYHIPGRLRLGAQGLEQALRQPLDRRHVVHMPGVDRRLRHPED